MANVPPEIRADIVMWNGLDNTREEIATNVNNKHGTSLSEHTVSEVVNEVEEMAEQEGAQFAYYRVLLRGKGVEIANQLARSFAAAY